MAHALRATEAPAAGLRRVFDEHVRAAGRCIGGPEDPTDDELHEVRRALKRARATLRLLRPAIDRKAFGTANVALRDAARPLMHARDARVLLDTVEQLRGEVEDAAARKQLATLKRSLRADYQAQRRRLTTGRDTLVAVSRALTDVQADANRWTWAHDEWPLLSRAIHRIYRDAHRAGRTAREKPTDANLHEWRKQVKHLDHALDLFQALRPGRLGVLRDESRRIAACLGDDHDLAVLTERLAREAVRDPGLASLQRVVDARRAVLQDRAMTLGEHLFTQRPKAFVASLEPNWEAWRSPASR